MNALPFYAPAPIPRYLAAPHVEMDLTIAVELAGVLVGEPEANVVIGWSNGDLDIVEYAIDGVRVDAYRWHAASKTDRSEHPDIAVFVTSCERAFDGAARREAADRMAEAASERAAA